MICNKLSQTKNILNEAVVGWKLAHDSSVTFPIVFDL